MSNTPALEPNAQARYIADELDRLRSRGESMAVVHVTPAWHEIIIEYLTTNGHAAANVRPSGGYIFVEFPEN